MPKCELGFEKPYKPIERERVAELYRSDDGLTSLAKSVWGMFIGPRPHPLISCYYPVESKGEIIREEISILEAPSDILIKSEYMMCRGTVIGGMGSWECEGCPFYK